MQKTNHGDTENTENTEELTEGSRGSRDEKTEMRIYEKQILTTISFHRISATSALSCSRILLRALRASVV
jgi:hypothetical protein